MVDKEGFPRNKEHPLIPLPSSHLEGQTRIPVGGEDLLDGVDVGGRSQVQAHVVLDGGLHDGSGRAFHGVVQAGVDNVFLRGTGNTFLEGLGRRHRDAAAHLSETAFQRLLHGFWTFRRNKSRMWLEDEAKPKSSGGKQEESKRKQKTNRKKQTTITTICN